MYNVKLTPVKEVGRMRIREGGDLKQNKDTKITHTHIERQQNMSAYFE